MTYKASFDPQTVISRFTQGEGVVKIAADVHAAPRVISRLLKSAGYHVGHSKHPVEVQKEIARRYAEGERTPALVKEFKVDRITLRNYILQHGGKMRTTFEDNIRHLSNDEKDTIERLYVSGMAIRKISTDVGVCVPKIVEVLHSIGIRPKMRLDLTTRRITAEGYVKIHYSVAGPFGKDMAQKRGEVLEHRAVMATHIGRPLRSNETVHHINGNTSDNRIENLQLRQGRHGNGAHFRCGDCGSHNIEPTKI